MRNFIWIFTHYVKKNFQDPANLLVIALPLVFIFAFQLLENYLFDFMEVESNFLYGMAIPMVLGFQFFCADLTAGWLHYDMKSPTRARLLVSPIAPKVFYMAVMAAGWLFSVFYGAIVVAITVVAFNIEWGNYAYVLVVLLALSFITQMSGVLIFRYTKDEKSSARMSYVFGEIMMGVAILPVLAANMTDLARPIQTILNHLPVSAGINVIANYNRLDSIAALLVWIAIFTAAAFIIGRQERQ
ncbi:MAG: ABC transporter permease [Defluviitaleaceae bacterium]|nr:ABC transporter permease [Defluviitaleaceae bacterium]